MRAAGQGVKCPGSSDVRRRMNPIVVTVVIVACAGIVACRPSERVTVTGTVRYDGQPVQRGAIVLVPLDSTSGPDGGTITAGRFSLEGRPGRRRVEVRGTRAMDENRVPRTMPRLGSVPVDEDYIPADFNTASTLEIEVTTDGPNTFDFDLHAP